MLRSQKSVIKLFLCMIVCIGLLVTSISCAAFAEELEEEIPAPCSVAYEISGYGDVECDIIEGQVGDIATITYKPYVFCKLVSIKVNGIDLIPSEDGTYAFALVEGVNTVSIEFTFDEDQVGMLAGYMNQAEEEGLASLFTMKNLMSLISWAISLLMGSGFLITWIKTKTIKSATSESVKNDCIKASNESINVALSSFISGTLSPALNKISVQLATTEEVCQVLARCMVLAQENTPEARLAIIEELTKLRTSSKDLAEAVKTLIAAEVEKKEAEELKQKQAIEELEKANEAIETIVEAPIEEKEETKASVVENY